MTEVVGVALLGIVRVSHARGAAQRAFGMTALMGVALVGVVGCVMRGVQPSARLA